MNHFLQLRFTGLTLLAGILVFIGAARSFGQEPQGIGAEAEPVLILDPELPAEEESTTLTPEETAAVPDVDKEADTLLILDLEEDAVDSTPVSEADAPPEDSLPPLEKMPELTRFIEADYPPSVYGKGIEGTVLMELLVNDSGTVDSVSVVEGVMPVLDSSAVAAARRFVFQPARADGEPVAVYIQYAYRFSLQEVVEKLDTYVNFRGRLLERGTRTPLSDALVVLHFPDTAADTALSVPFSVYLQHLGDLDGQYLEENRLVTLTDSMGNFSFSSLPVGPVEISSPIPGYEAFEEQEKITPGEELSATYYVRKLSYSDYEIVVYYKSEEKEVSRRQLTLQEVKKVPGLGGDAVKVVQALPGVARPTFGSSQIVVRGAGTNDSKYYLDGIEIPLLFHFGLKSTYNSDALEKVDFYPGGFGVRYGSSIAGVVEITGRKAKTDRWHGYADASLLDGSFFVEGPVNDKVSVLGTARRSFIGDVIRLGIENVPSTFVLTTAPYYWDYILRTDIDFSDDQHLYVTGFGVKDGTELLSTSVRGGNEDIDAAKNSLKAEVLFNMGILGWDAVFSDHFKNELRLSVGYVESFVSAFGVFKSTTDYMQYFLRDQATFTLNEKVAFNLGADIRMWPIDLVLKIPTGDNIVRVDKEEDWWFGDLGAYLDCEWKPWENLLIVPGIRYDLYPELDYNGALLPAFWEYSDFDNTTRFSGEPSFRLTTRWELVPDHTVKFSLGNYSKTPEPIGQSIHPFWGDPELKATRASQYVLGYEWQLTDLVNLDVQGYINRNWNMARGVDPGENASGKLYVYDGKRRMQGLELMLRHEQGEHFFGWIAYSLARSEFYSYDENRWALTGKDQTHNLIGVASWRLPKNWEFGLKLQFTSGDPYTPVVDAPLYENYHFYDVEYGAVNSERMEPHFQLDIRFDKKFVFRKWTVDAYIDFFNINYFLYKSPQVNFLNFSDPWDPETQTANESTAYQYSLPTVGLKISF